MANHDQLPFLVYYRHPYPHPTSLVRSCCLMFVPTVDWKKRLGLAENDIQRLSTGEKISAPTAMPLSTTVCRSWCRALVDHRSQPVEGTPAAACGPRGGGRCNCRTGEQHRRTIRRPRPPDASAKSGSARRGKRDGEDKGCVGGDSGEGVSGGSGIYRRC